VEVAVPVPLRRTFTYLWSDDGIQPQPGQRVRVPFGRRRLTGVVVGPSPDPPEPDLHVRGVEAVIDRVSLLPPALLELARFAADYYVAPVGEMVRSVLPAGLGPAGEAPPAQGPSRRVVTLCVAAGGVEEALAALRRAPSQTVALRALQEIGGRAPVTLLAARGIRPATVKALAARGLVRVTTEPLPPAVVPGLPAGEPARPVLLMPEQEEAVAEIRAAVRSSQRRSFLLHGVTGSGKTEVYLRAAAEALTAGKGVIILVPEIGLTPALVGRLSERFGDRLAVLHSGLAPRERRAHWDRVRRGEATLVVGARSAVFAPLSRVGLIIVDEEQDTSYKQEESPRYQARDLALVRGRLESCPVVLASATPAMESYSRARSGRHRLLVLPRRVAARRLPDFEIVDLREEFRDVGEVRLFSRSLVEALASNRRAGGQAMLLLNRRGWAAFLLCRACGEPVTCDHCSVSLTHHRPPERLLCHYCGFRRPVPASCPACGETTLQEMGAGTVRLEDELHRVCPELRVLRMDADAVRAQGGHARLLARFAAGGADILLGTQMIAKGHDFPGVTLVGILGGDAILGFPDFRAAEWTFHLATQAAGRAGRGRDRGRVILQAYRADHYALQRAREHDYPGFFLQEDRFRRALLYPPHAVLAAVRVRHRDLEQAFGLVRNVEERLRDDADAGERLRILGPAPAPLARVRGRFRFHLLLKSASRRRLGAVLQRLAAGLERERIAGARVEIDVDPASIL
jgi:primosomal protein N' (replication factor Y)